MRGDFSIHIGRLVFLYGSFYCYFNCFIFVLFSVSTLQVKKINYCILWQYVVTVILCAVHKIDSFDFVSRNICHGSDSVDTANREIKLWFKDEELVDWEPEMAKWIYE